MNTYEDFVCIFCSGNGTPYEQNCINHCMLIDGLTVCSGYAKDRIRCPYWNMGDY
jgi:hypothetical protein